MHATSTCKTFIGYCLRGKEVFKLRGKGPYYYYGDIVQGLFNPHSIGATLAMMTSLLIVPQVDIK